MNSVEHSLLSEQWDNIKSKREQISRIEEEIGLQFQSYKVNVIRLLLKAIGNCSPFENPDIVVWVSEWNSQKPVERITVLEGNLSETCDVIFSMIRHSKITGINHEDETIRIDFLGGNRPLWLTFSTNLNYDKFQK